MLPTWAILKIGEVRAYFQAAESALHHVPLRKRGRGGGQIYYRLFELDVKDMFPRLPRAGVTEAVGNIAAAVVQALEGTEWGGGRVHLQSSGLRFAIHKRHRRLNRLGPAYCNEYDVISMEEITRYIMFDVHKNDIFTIGGKIFRQKRGVAIGGLCSAQLAELYCMWCECLAHRAGSHSHLWKRLPVFAVPLCPYRSGDNIVGLVRNGVQLTRIQAILESMYHLEPGLVPYAVHERVPSANAYRLVLIPHSTCVVQMVPQTGTALQHARTLDGKLPDELKYCEKHAAGSKVYYRCW